MIVNEIDSIGFPVYTKIKTETINIEHYDIKAKHLNFK